MRMNRWLVVSSLVLAVLLVSARPAAAGMALGLDLNASKLVGSNTKGAGPGFGGNLRLGYELPIPVLNLQPGVLLRYNKWKYDSAGVSGNLTDVDGMVGGRVALGALLKLTGQAFVGYGQLKPGGGLSGDTVKGASVLVGVGLGIGLPVIQVGIHVDYNKLVADSDKSATQWIAGGADLTLTF